MRNPVAVLSEFDEMVATIRQIPMFGGLDEEQLRAISEEARLVVLLKGRILFRAGEMPRHFYLLASGCIRLDLPAEAGKEPKAMDIMMPGEALCKAATILGEEYFVTAQATMDSKLIAVPRGYMMRLLEAGGALTRKLIEDLCKRVLDIHQKVAEVNGRSASQRVACYLLHFSPKLDSPCYEMTLPVSKQAVASHLNMTKESFSRALKEMREMGILQVKGRTIGVLDSARLRMLR